MVYIKNNLGAFEPDDFVTYNIALLKMILISLQKSGSLEEKKVQYQITLFVSTRNLCCLWCRGRFNQRRWKTEHKASSGPEETAPRCSSHGRSPTQTYGRVFHVVRNFLETVIQQESPCYLTRCFHYCFAVILREGFQVRFLSQIFQVAVS